MLGGTAGIPGGLFTAASAKGGGNIPGGSPGNCTIRNQQRKRTVIMW